MSGDWGNSLGALVIYENDFSDKRRAAMDGATPYDSGIPYDKNTAIFDNLSNLALNGKEPYVHQRAVHSFPANVTNGVLNYGICLGCHDGSRATAVSIWHARQTAAELPADTNNDGYNFHFDVLRRSPGREKFGALWMGTDPGSGKTNTDLFYSHGEKWYTKGDAQTRAKDAIKGTYNKRGKWQDPDADPYYSGPSETFSLVPVPCFVDANTGTGNDLEGLCATHGSRVPVLPDPAAATAAVADRASGP